MNENIDLSIVVPVYNEEDSIVPFLEKTMPICDSLVDRYEIIIVNDGSHDNTPAQLANECSKDSRIKVINLSRNFGKEAALSAGLSYTKGNAIIPMDIDLQDPPNVIVELYHKHVEGYDVVLAKRRRRSDDTFFKRYCAKIFYKIFKMIGDIDTVENTGDFRLMSRQVVNVINNMPEKTRFMKGILSWPGFKTTYIEYDRPSRMYGSTKWNTSSLIKLALDGLFSFSTKPLKVWIYIGFFTSLLAIIYMILMIIKVIVTGVDVPGYASLLSSILFLGGINLMGIGVLGEYIGRIYIEVKARPTYVVASKINIK